MEGTYFVFYCKSHSKEEEKSDFWYGYGDVSNDLKGLDYRGFIEIEFQSIEELAAGMVSNLSKFENAGEFRVINLPFPIIERTEELGPMSFFKRPLERSELEKLAKELGKIEGHF